MIKFSFALFVAGFMALLSGCQTLPLKQEREARMSEMPEQIGASPSEQLSSQEKSERSEEEALSLFIGDGVSASYMALGVMAELDRRKIPVSSIYATGIGSLIGALYAEGGSATLAEWKGYQLKEEEWFDIPLLPSSHSFSPGERRRLFLQKVLKAKRFEDLKIPLVILAATWPEGKVVLFRRGNLSGALMAASAIPGIFPPVQIGNQLYVSAGYGREALHLTQIEGNRLISIVPQEEYRAGTLRTLAQRVAVNYFSMRLREPVSFSSLEDEEDLRLDPLFSLPQPFDLSKKREWTLSGSRMIQSHLN
ncbi:MAG: patatin-like phospholipase family protein [Deltaproteobacteria bacterium]|nr:patatin-like phospholipase family protein [Deltaproteobacteria bacterium]